MSGAGSAWRVPLRMRSSGPVHTALQLWQSQGEILRDWACVRPTLLSNGVVQQSTWRQAEAVPTGVRHVDARRWRRVGAVFAFKGLQEPTRWTG